MIEALNITNFQARASKTGDMFEYSFWYLMKNKYKIELKTGVSIPKACMVDGGELDFALYKENKKSLTYLSFPLNNIGVEINLIRRNA